jgi:hypothetical protein
MSRASHIDEDDGYRDDEIPTVPCPYCKAEILEDSERCPRCENYLSAEDTATSGKPLWIWVLLILGTLLMIFSAFQ